MYATHALVRDALQLGVVLQEKLQVRVRDVHLQYNAHAQNTEIKKSDKEPANQDRRDQTTARTLRAQLRAALHCHALPRTATHVQVRPSLAVLLHGLPAATERMRADLDANVFRRVCKINGAVCGARTHLRVVACDKSPHEQAQKRHHRQTSRAGKTHVPEKTRVPENVCTVRNCTVAIARNCTAATFRQPCPAAPNTCNTHTHAIRIHVRIEVRTLQRRKKLGVDEGRLLLAHARRHVSASNTHMTHAKR